MESKLWSVHGLAQWSISATSWYPCRCGKVFVGHLSSAPVRNHDKETQLEQQYLLPLWLNAYKARGEGQKWKKKVHPCMKHKGKCMEWIHGSLFLLLPQLEYNSTLGNECVMYKGDYTTWELWKLNAPNLGRACESPSQCPTCMGHCTTIYRG